MEAAADNPSVVDIYIIDIIGGWDDDWIARNWGYDMGVTARAFVEQLAKLSDEAKTIRVHINSPGGDVFGAVNIANALRDQQVSKGRTVETIVDGLAASAASIVLMAGSIVRMADNGLVMIHNPWSIGIGEAKDMRKLADDLDTVRNTIIATYKWHSQLEDDDIVALMDETTWMDADEAIANGFATEKVEGLKAAAALDPRAVAKLSVPEKYRARVDALLKQTDPPAATPTPAAATDVLRLCREADCLDLAESLIAAQTTLDQAQARVADEKQTRAVAKARAQQIRALCETARLPELGQTYIDGGMGVEAVRAQLAVITAKVDRVEIDGSLPIDQGVATGDSWKKAFARVKRRAFAK
jgi:ATP-dependent protease ClpP protease subunit